MSLVDVGVADEVRPELANVPRLWLPFGLVGAAAGWLSNECLSGPLLVVTSLQEAWLAAIVTGAVGLLLGLRLRSLARLEFADELLAARIASSVMIAGVASGALVAACSSLLVYGYWGRDAVLYPIGTGALVGFGSSLAFLPLCTIVVAAARRAVRARHGSIVAASDARDVWGVLGTSLAVATLAMLPGWTLDLWGILPPRPPLPVLWILGGAVSVVATLVLMELRGRRRIAAACAAAEQMDAGHRLDLDRCEARPTDLGLGDDVRTARAAGGPAYRGLGRVTGALVGCHELARANIDRAVRRRELQLVTIAAVLVAHLAAGFDVLCVLWFG